MPSPDTWVSIYEATQISGIKYRVIAEWIYRGYLKAKIGRYYKPVYSHRTRQRAGRRTSMFLWKDFEDVLARYKPGNNGAGAQETARPEGYVTMSEASDLLGVDRTYIRRLMGENRLPFIKVNVNGVGKKYFLYVEKKAVDALAEEKGDYRRIGFVPAKEKAPERPLICGNHAVCLDARRQLWEQNQRVFKACENYVDMKKEAG